MGLFGGFTEKPRPLTAAQRVADEHRQMIGKLSARRRKALDAAKVYSAEGDFVGHYEAMEYLDEIDVEIERCRARLGEWCV